MKWNCWHKVNNLFMFPHNLQPQQGFFMIGSSQIWLHKVPSVQAFRSVVVSPVTISGRLHFSCPRLTASFCLRYLLMCAFMLPLSQDSQGTLFKRAFAKLTGKGEKVLRNFYLRSCLWHVTALMPCAIRITFPAFHLLKITMSCLFYWINVFALLMFLVRPS